MAPDPDPYLVPTDPADPKTYESATLKTGVRY
jgi:hypothetical protein